MESALSILHRIIQTSICRWIWRMDGEMGMDWYWEKTVLFPSKFTLRMVFSMVRLPNTMITSMWFWKGVFRRERKLACSLSTMRRVTKSGRDTIVMERDEWSWRNRRNWQIFTRRGIAWELWRMWVTSIPVDCARMVFRLSWQAGRCHAFPNTGMDPFNALLWRWRTTY